MSPWTAVRPKGGKHLISPRWAQDSGERAVLAKLCREFVGADENSRNIVDVSVEHPIPVVKVVRRHAVWSMDAPPPSDIVACCSDDVGGIGHELTEDGPVQPE
ncbi:hypothetical protein, partial [Brevibacterium sp. NPDC056947]|uniref:hypothetical protein n=1 Tax=Brevibacterium sp. NPDC056947 TaxID=3345974 RepID=UPI0036329F6B